MRTIIVVALVTACAPEATPLDVSVPDAPSPPACQASSCNPLTQTGCNADEQCTWVLGGPCGDHVGCRPRGTLAPGAACTHDAAGADACATGDVCIAGTCRRICDHQGGEPRCEAGEVCTVVAGVFTDGSGALAGACVP